MSLSSWLPWTFSRSPARRARHCDSASRRKKARRFLEHLEDRAVLSSYTAPTVSALIADIQAANAAGGANTISLTAATTSPYRLLSALPEIAATDNLTIVGNSDNTIEAGKEGSMIAVARGATLTLDNLQVRGFTNLDGTGGAIYSQGALTLSAVTVSSNESGWALREGSQGQGGAIWSSGSLTMENGTLFEKNTAIGGEGLGPAGGGIYGPGPPGNAYGGAVYIAGGTANISDTTFEANIAEGGLNTGAATGTGGAGFGGAVYVAGGQVVISTTNIDGNQAVTGADGTGGVSYGAGLYVAGGTVQIASCTVDSNTASESATAGYGGGLYVAAGTVTLTNCTVQSNTAAYGGGIYIASMAMVSIDPFTVAHVVNNTASTDPNIDGTYILT
jgi:hypothetical protein